MSTSLALKRLRKEAQKLAKSPLPGVMAVPKEDNLLVWDGAIVVNIPTRSPTLLHFLIEFSEEYPSAAPKVGFSVEFQSSESGATKIASSGPLKGKIEICLNLLGNFAFVHTEWASVKNEGWTPSCDIAFLLVNLQYLVNDGIQHCSYQNGTLHHNCNTFLNTNRDSIPVELLSLLDATPPLEDEDEDEAGETTKSSSPSIEDELTCWYTTLSFKEDVLGYGVKLEFPGGAGKVCLMTDADYISHTAYESGMRQFPSKEHFQGFLPAWINKEHSSQTKWLIVMKAAMSFFQKQVSNLKSLQDTVIWVYSELINTLVVKIMDQASDMTVSFKTFKCVVNLWRSFLHLLDLVENLRTTVVSKVTRFMNEDRERLKGQSPNIGWIIVMSMMCSSTELDWAQFTYTYEDESFLRRVLWWQKDRSNSLTPSSTYAASAIGRKISLFQMLFRDVVITNDIAATIDALEVSNCSDMHRLDTLLTRWKDIDQRMHAPDANWFTHQQELLALGMSSVNSTLMTNNEASIKLQIDRYIARANQLDGYHFIQRAHNEHSGSYSGRGRGGGRSGNNQGFEGRGRGGGGRGGGDNAAGGRGNNNNGGRGGGRGGRW